MLKITIEAATMSEAYLAFRTLWENHNRLQDDDYSDKRHSIEFVDHGNQTWIDVWGTYERPKVSYSHAEIVDAE